MNAALQRPLIPVPPVFLAAPGFLSRSGTDTWIRSAAVNPLIGSISPNMATLPLLVFLAELCVVTIGTVRIIFVARGMKILAPILGFFEVSIWLFAIGQIMQNLTDLSCYLAFAGGFTAGNYLEIGRAHV